MFRLYIILDKQGGPGHPWLVLNNVFGFFFSPLHFLFMPGLFWGPLGVWGLLIPWYWYLAFFSLGFRIWKFQVFRCRGANHSNIKKKAKTLSIPGRSTWVFHPLTSFLQHCQTLRNSLELRKGSPTVSLQRTRSHLPQPSQELFLKIRFWFHWFIPS